MYHPRDIEAHSVCLGGVSSRPCNFYGERVVPDFLACRGYDIDNIGKNVRTLLEGFVTGASGA